MTTADALTERKVAVGSPHGTAHGVPVLVLGMSLSTFLAISYVLCIVGYLIFPGLPVNHAALAIFLPGFELLSWSTFLLGLVETFVWGWYIALVFAPIYNFFAGHRR